MLEASLVAPVDTSAERVEHRHEGPRIDEMPTFDQVPSAMTQFLDDAHPQQVDEVFGGIPGIEEVPEEIEGSRAVTNFTEDSQKIATLYSSINSDLAF